MALFGRGKSLLGLDIGTSAVKAIELSRSGSGLVISGYGSAPIESPDTLADTIQTVLRDAGIRTKRCVTAVSGRSVIIRQVPMAQVPDSDLRQAIEYEADKYIPFDVNEVQLDVQRLAGVEGDVPQGQMKVLLVAVKRSLIDEHVALLQSVGLQPVIIDVDCFALGNAFELRNLSLGISDDEVRALVDIGASKTNINIMRGNTSYFQREIYVAGNDLTEAIAKRFGEDPKDVEKMKKEPGGALESMQDAMLPVLEDIGNEIRLSFDYFENQYDKQVSEVYLSGGSAYFPGLDTMFTQIFNLPTKVWDPTEGLEITGVNPAGMGGANSDMSIALGLAARLLGSLGWTSTSAMISTGSSSDAATAPTAVSTPTAISRPTSIGAAQAMASAEARKHWMKGLGLGTAMAAVMAVLLGFLQTAGYVPWWSILEALPMGIAAGFGMWVGMKAIRPIPGRFSIVLGAVMVGTISCGLLLGLRYVNGVPLKETHKVEKIERTVDPSKLKLSPELQRRLEEQRSKGPAMDADDISGVVRIGTHWLGTGALAMLIVWMQFLAVSRKEARAGWAKTNVTVD